MNTQNPETDVWSEWLLHLRHGDDLAFGEVVRSDVDDIINRMLDAAGLKPGLRLADIGTGEGVVAFKAIERVGPTLKVICTDVSTAMLRHAAATADARQIHAQCSFLQCSAERLDGISDATVDVLTCRAVLAYVADRNAALREFYRVLKPGGRISVAEPVLQDDAFLAAALKSQIDTHKIDPNDHFLPLLHRWKAAQYPDTMDSIAQHPLVNYSERNLFEFVRNAGFLDVHLELHIDLNPYGIHSWETFLRTSPHPLASSNHVILQQQFIPEERALFEQVLRPTIESPDAAGISRTVYVTAMKPLG